MGTRPLRQYYDGVTIVVDDDLPLLEPWWRHRRRLVDELTALTEDQWKATTRCTSWDVRGVVSHLVTVDVFWVTSLRAAHARETPTTFIRGFDPSTGTDDFVAPMLELPTDAILDAFVAGTDTFVTTVEAFDRDDWDSPGEAPFGHVSARLALAHAFWDSWVHERDILEPLGLLPNLETDEVLAATWYSLVMGGVQGGLLGDKAPVGPGPDAEIDVMLQFDDLPADPLRVRIDSGVHVNRAVATSGLSTGSAVDFVEGITGRRPFDSLSELPPDLALQIARAAQIL